jgi:16S rRNA U516 pseudouridylate synthase RsuA-like enzyme
MFEAVGHPVTHLHRSVYAGLTLEGLEPGAWRELEPDEVASLVRVFGRGNLDN